MTSMEDTLKAYNAKKQAKLDAQQAQEAATRAANAPPPMTHKCSKCGSPCRGGCIVWGHVYCNPCYDRRLDQQSGK